MKFKLGRLLFPKICVEFELHNKIKKIDQFIDFKLPSNALSSSNYFRDQISKYQALDASKLKMIRKMKILQNFQKNR